MKYLETYSIWESKSKYVFGDNWMDNFIKKTNDNIKDVINESLIDLSQSGMGITSQIQRGGKTPDRVVIYITGIRLAALHHKDFSFDDIKDPVYHLISSMEEVHCPLVNASYRRYEDWNILWNIKTHNENTTDNIFGDSNIGEISSFGLIFEL